MKTMQQLLEILKKDIIAINKRKRKEKSIIKEFLTFDIEVSSFYNNDNEKNACMYVYAFCYKNEVFYGREWDDFIEFIKYIDTNLNERRMLIYVHNLSYEFQFIRKFFKWEQVFALDERKVAYARINNVEFRCSYILSNYSLGKLADNLINHKIKKLNETYDYYKIRTPKTVLTNEEYKYLANDVLIVYYYILEQLDIYKQMRNIPLTNTSRVRRLLLTNMGRKENYKELQKLQSNLTLNLEEYDLLRLAFCGGFTHSNTYRTNLIIENVHSYDFTSSYPYVLISEKYPMGKGTQIKIKDLKEFHELVKTHCLLISVTFINIENIFKYENIISESKCFNKESVISENGRVRSASKISLLITEQDYVCIKKFYKYESFIIHKVIAYKKDYLPKEFINTILELYAKKTTLKDVEGKELEYQNSKGMLNSLYGMCATNIIRDEIIYDNDYEWNTVVPEELKKMELINKYNSSKKRCLFYPWGVWCTAYARRNLFTAIYELKEDYIYSDTDSVKFTNLEKHINYFDNYNKNSQEKLKLMCLAKKIDYDTFLKPKTIKGVTKLLGVFDYEGKSTYFKTLGAKRYLTYDKETNKLKMTVAGVAKSASKHLLNRFNNDIIKVFNEFKDGLIFPKEESGKLTHTYIDYETTCTIKDYLGVECEVHELSSVHLEEASYELGMGEEYINAINLALMKGMGQYES